MSGAHYHARLQLASCSLLSCSLLACSLVSSKLEYSQRKLRDCIAAANADAQGDAHAKGRSALVCLQWPGVLKYACLRATQWPLGSRAGACLEPYSL